MANLRQAGWLQQPKVQPDVVEISDLSLNECDRADKVLLVAHGLPRDLVEPGLQLFKNCQRLAEVVNRVSAPQTLSLVSGMLSLELRAVGEDDTLHGIREEMTEDRYGLLSHVGKLPSKDAAHPGLIVDAGVNIGDFSISAWLLHPTTQVLAFEPSAETFFIVLWNMRANSVPLLQLSDLGKPGKFGVLALHGALTEDGKDITFYHNPKRSQISAVAKPGYAKPEGWTEELIPSYNLAKTLEQHAVSTVHLFKIDCEGCEFAILGGLYDWISSKDKVRQIEGEIHWHLACPNQYEDPVEHVSSQAADAAERALHDRGCPLIHEARQAGNNWKGRGDVSRSLSC